MTIHSFRRVLKVRRHIHVIPWNPGKALVLPRPVPLLGFTYFAILEVLFLILSRLPIVGTFSHLPFKLWWVIPFWLTYFALTSSFDGRMPHMWVRSWIAFRLRPKRTRAGLAVRADGSSRLRGRVRWWVDEHAPQLHRARIAGPATVRIRVPARFQLGLMHRAWEVRPDRYGPDEQSHRVVDRLEVRP